jgi:hypothetical protein
MAIIIKDNIKMGDFMGKANIYGRMALVMMEHL